jgi:outer membrane murein-binding lipoprotein Lpp
MSIDDDLHSLISHDESVSLNRTKTSTADAGLYKRATNNLSDSFSEAKVKRLEEEVQDLKDRLAQLKKDREHLDSQMHNMNSSLETALRDCQRRCAEYADDVKCLKYTLSEKNPADRKLLYQQERQIEALRHSLSERQQNAAFSKLSADEHHVPKQDDIENAMYSIHHETKKILLSYDDNFTARTPDLDHEDDLRSLFGRTLGINPSSRVNSETLKLMLEKNGLQAIICSLFASGLCEWVFATDFESTIAKSSMLLNMYRQHISSIGKPLRSSKGGIQANQDLLQTAAMP